MDNRIYLVANEKGGVGKTSLCLTLAVARARAGYPVILVDTDRQETASTWASMRLEAGHRPAMICVQKTGKLGLDLVQLKENYEVFVDAGGRDTVEMRQAVAVADEWLIPVMPQQFDILSIAKMRQLHTEIREKVDRAPNTRIVLNAIPPSTNEGENTRELLADVEEMPVMSSSLYRRIVWNRAAMSWCTVPELTGKLADKSAVQEVEALYLEFFGEEFHVQS